MCPSCKDLTRWRFFVFVFFSPDFSSVKIFRKTWTTLAVLILARKNNGNQTSGWACRTRVQNFRIYLSITAWTFGVLCVKRSKIRYFLQMTWFWGRIQFFRLILLNVEHRQVRSSILCAKNSSYTCLGVTYVRPDRAKCGATVIRPRLEKAPTLCWNIEGLSLVDTSFAPRYGPTPLKKNCPCHPLTLLL